MTKDYFGWAKELIKRSSFVSDIKEYLEADQPYVEIVIKERQYPTLQFGNAVAVTFGNDQYSVRCDKGVFVIVILIQIEDHD